MGEWDAIRAIPEAVQVEDIIRIRDGTGIKKFKVEGRRVGYFLGRKKRRKGWSCDLKRAYYSNVVAPVLIEPAEPELPAAVATVVCPRCHGTMMGASDFRPPITYNGFICLNCGHKHDEEPTTKRPLTEKLLPEAGSDAE